MSSAIWARRAVAALACALLTSTAVTQQARSQVGQQPDQHPMASAMVSADRKTQGPAAPPQPIRNDVVIRGGTILTATHGTIQNGSIYVHDGKIASVGASVNAPASATVIDATGKFVTPGIIDPHAHMALDRDVNEATNPVVPHMKMLDAFNYTDKAIYRALAGGVTTSLLLHGSADMIGGQGLIIKTKYGLGRNDLIVPNQPRNLKFASGENPKRVFGQRNQLPSTRMGNFEVLRDALQQGKEYLEEQKRYRDKLGKGDKDVTPPNRDLKLEALGEILQ